MFKVAFVGCFSSLIFTMWFGFGQTAARNFAKNPLALEKSPLLQEWKNATTALLKPITVEQCPSDWWFVNDTSKFSVFDKDAWKAYNGTADPITDAR